jgi:autotransporter-associated beta strand protein
VRRLSPEGGVTLKGGSITTAGTGFIQPGPITTEFVTSTISGRLQVAGDTWTVSPQGTVSVVLDVPAVVFGTGITKDGVGSLRLSGINTFTGGLELKQGTLLTGNDSALGTGALTIDGAATIQADGGPRVVNNAIVINGGSNDGLSLLTAPMTSHSTAS